MRRAIQRSISAAVLSLTISMSACAGEGYVYAPDAPPPPQEEVVGVAPYSGAVWIGGYWGWEGGRHTWHAGRWDRARPGYTWETHRWERQGNRWAFRQGRWRRR